MRKLRVLQVASPQPLNAAREFGNCCGVPGTPLDEGKRGRGGRRGGGTREHLRLEEREHSLQLRAIGFDLRHVVGI